MLVCFDQLDGMDSPDLINAWGKVLSLLVNDVSGMLPLAFHPRLGLVHRIDKDTSGLLVIAKKPEAKTDLGRNMPSVTILRTIPTAATASSP